MNQHFDGKYKKENGVLVFTTLAHTKRFERFVARLPERCLVDFYCEVTHDDGSLPQLAKIHAMIRTLAMHIGESFENIKLVVKDRAGLCLTRNLSGKEYFIPKSFGECSMEELSLAITAAIELGEEVNCPVG